MRWAIVLTCWTAGWLALAIRPAWGESTAWHTGPGLAAQLDTPFSVSWSNVPLRRALSRLGESQRVAIVLDRRIDPDQLIQLTITQQPLAAGFEAIADHLHAGYCQLGNVAYIGPTSIVARLRTLAGLRLEDAKNLGPRGRDFLELRSWHWDEATEPRALVEQLASQAECKVVGIDSIPHDLWAEADWPLLTWVDRLTLVTAQFDLTFRFLKQGREIELVPAPVDVALTRSYPAGKDATARAAQWKEALPQANVRVQGTQIRVTARLEDHERLEQRMKPQPAKSSGTARKNDPPGKEVFQLSIQSAALSNVVEQLAKRLDLRIQWDRAQSAAAGISPDQLVSVKVQDASLDELLSAVFKGTGLQFERQDRTVTISPAR